MLPEVLSNGICSLQEGVPRFCKSAFMAYDRRGNILRSGVASTLIHSAKRLTYLEAQALIDNDEKEARKHAKTEPNYTEELITTLREFDACIGLGRLVAIHANDSKKERGSRVDRHESIGRGKIGRDAFRLLMNHPRLAGIPLILETPKEGPDGTPHPRHDRANLALLRRLAQG
jgi:hypothetical protein